MSWGETLSRASPQIHSYVSTILEVNLDLEFVLFVFVIDFPPPKLQVFG
jgi:hypothetical protein